MDIAILRRYKHYIREIYFKLQEQAEKLSKEILKMEYFKQHDIKSKRSELYELERDILKTSRQLGGI